MPVIPEFFYRESIVRPRFPIKHFGNDGAFGHYNCQLKADGLNHFPCFCLIPLINEHHDASLLARYYSIYRDKEIYLFSL